MDEALLYFNRGSAMDRWWFLLPRSSLPVAVQAGRPFWSHSAPGRRAAVTKTNLISAAPATRPTPVWLANCASPGSGLGSFAVFGAFLVDTNPASPYNTDLRGAAPCYLTRCLYLA